MAELEDAHDSKSCGSNTVRVQLPPRPPLYFMIPVTGLRSGTTFEDKGEIFEVVSYQHTKIGRGSANIKIKAQNLKTGQQVQKTFISGSRVEEAYTKKKKLQFLYEDSESLVFMDLKTYDQFPIKTSVLGNRKKFLKEGETFEVLFFEDIILNVILPKLMELKVTETSPGVRGDTVSNVFKPATLENGMQIKAPLFIKQGDKVKVDTRSGEYVERVKS